MLGLLTANTGIINPVVTSQITPKQSHYKHWLQLRVSYTAPIIWYSSWCLMIAIVCFQTLSCDTPF